MRRIRVAGILAGAILALSACDPAPITDPLNPDALAQGPEPTVLAEQGEPFCVYKCIKCLPPNAEACEWHCVWIGACHDTPLAIDRNENGRVCSATEGGEGPFVDDVWPQPAVVRFRLKEVEPCPSGQYPHWVEVEES
jgi:hypothetical protein